MCATHSRSVPPARTGCGTVASELHTIRNLAYAPLDRKSLVFARTKLAQGGQSSGLAMPFATRARSGARAGELVVSRHSQRPARWSTGAHENAGVAQSPSAATRAATAAARMRSTCFTFGG